MNNSAQYLAIDIGGTKIEICLFDENYQLLSSEKYETNDFSIHDIKFLSELEKLVEQSLHDSIQKIGVSFNCVIKDGVILYSSLLGGPVNYPLAKNWSEKFGREVFIENDVNAMARAESKMGKAQYVKDFVLLNIGTGIRLSHVHNGEVIGGYNNCAGEVSQRKMTIPELHNKEFKIDNFVSGRGLSNIYFEYTGEKKSTKEIFQIYEQDEMAQKSIDLFTKYFAGFLSDISYFYNPEVIVINGSLKKASQIFLQKALHKYQDNNFDFFYFKDVRISEIDHGASLGVIL